VAITKTDQFQAWPPATTGDDWLDDGEGVHTIFPRDLATQLNNIATYCNPWAQYMQSCTAFNGKDGVLGTFVTAAGEYPLLQCPIVVPPGAIRMFWTAGVVDASGTGTIESARVYLSTNEYTKTLMGDSAAAFDYTGIFPRKRLFGNVYAAPKSSEYKPVNLATAGYRLVSDTQTDGGITGLDASCITVSSGTGQTRLSNVVVTLKVLQASSLSMGIADFTCWFGFD
jgi:hypothetical protein